MGGLKLHQLCTMAEPLLGRRAVLPTTEVREDGTDREIEYVPGGELSLPIEYVFDGNCFTSQGLSSLEADALVARDPS